LALIVFHCRYNFGRRDKIDETHQDTVYYATEEIKILEELHMNPIQNKLAQYEQNWLEPVRRM
jgi:hypothetical protein